ncbi:MULTISPECIES: hypothetical protein [unclassified Thalassospira]|uniref:hypothetical protein n=1 Tax=unclassified Thalassospira TaxID=2648997 RepID=UPI000EF00E11|nr:MULTISPECIES: hypothetical protein [unclassified Thalassospira]HAI28219.1 hypothetical protein [Thalassospira sp.]|tara:strand:+ start:17098 stop:17733 length:636 start_codon:yes stop_codon:yes gene_type:complete
MSNYGQSLQLVLNTYIGGATKLLTSDMRKRVGSVFTQIENTVANIETLTAKVTAGSVSDPASQLENCERSGQMLAIAVRSLEQTLQQLASERVAAIKKSATIEQGALSALDKKQKNLDDQLLENVKQISKAVGTSLDKATQTLKDALQVVKKPTGSTGHDPSASSSDDPKKPSSPDLKIAVPKLSEVMKFDTTKTEKMLDDLATILLGKGA